MPMNIGSPHAYSGDSSGHAGAEAGGLSFVFTVAGNGLTARPQGQE
jgi:hypothetical protein